MTEGIPGVDLKVGPGDDGLAYHVLDLPPGAAPSDLFDLINQLYPGVPLAPPVDAPVPITALTLLYGLDQNPADGTSWCLVTPRRRGGAPKAGTVDPDGLYFAFSEGLPQEEELDIVVLMLSLARRLDGIVTFDAQLQPAAAQVEPDPNIRIDLVVWSPTALRADELLSVIRDVEPDAELPEDLVPPAQTASPQALDPVGYAGRHTASTERVPQRPRDEDGYVTVVVPLEDTESPDLTPDDEELDGLIVALGPADGSLPLPRGVPSHHDEFCYVIRWLPLEVGQLLTDLPEPGFVESREFAQCRLRLVASAVANAVDGIVVDADGFLVDPNPGPVRRD